LPSIFGAKPTAARLTRCQRSLNWRDGAFDNPVPTVKTLPGTMGWTLRHQLLGKEQREPPAPLPIVRPDPTAHARPPASGLRATWLGHSTVLLEIDGLTILTDPVWAERASPFRWAGPRRFHPPPLALAMLPAIDVVLLSHDHYDHLDMDAIRSLASHAHQRNARFVAPLGLGAHLERWGVDEARIVELDWWDSAGIPTASGDVLSITATPARHFSGRGIRDTFGRGNPTLWASFAIATAKHRVFFSGDTGQWDGFTRVGEELGPFDLAMVKIGAYGPTWPDIHLDPEQAVHVTRHVKARVLLPIHWGTFNLAFHAWDEPAERVVVAAREAGVTLAMPRPGESFEPASPPAVQEWWRSVGAAAG
jgi:L-ascorbate metabolism protein UlaG (beta-lactamase superfamily)